MTRFHVRMQRTDRTWAYVASVSWTPGDGWKVQSVRLTADRERAFGFTEGQAAAIAKQYSHRVVEVVSPAGAPAPVQAEVERANAVARVERAEARREFETALAEAITAARPELRAAVESALGRALTPKGK